MVENWIGISYPYQNFRRALRPLWGKSGLSKLTISRANHTLKDAFHAWRERDLSSEDIVYLFLDDFYLGVRQGSKGKEAVLVAHGINRGGKRMVLHPSLGGRESTDSWKSVLHDLEDRGLKPPQLIISDGNPGLLRAICDIWPEAPRQRCIVHRIWNVLARVPKKRQAEVKRTVSWLAMDENFPLPPRYLAKHLGECLTFYRFPEHHWKNIRGANALERAFKEVRRRINVIGRFSTETAALAVVFGILEEERLKWRQVNMKAEDIVWITEAVKSLDLEPILAESLQAMAV